MEIPKAETEGNYQETINAFFLEKHDGDIVEDGRRRRKSVLIALQNDLDFTRGVYRRWRSLELSESQIKKRNQILPSFAVISLFCSGIDVLVRAEMKGRHNRKKTGKLFKDFLSTHLELSDEASEQLRELRNSVSHQYAVLPNHGIRECGSHLLIEKNSKGSWTINLNAMRSHLFKASHIIYEKMSNEALSEKKKMADYLNKNGFFFV